MPPHSPDGISLRQHARRFIALLALLAASVAGGHAPALEASDAWIRAIPGSDVAAVYFTLRNRGGVPRTVSAVSSPFAGAAMIHETQMTNGISSMRPHEHVTLAPGQSVHFEPGGLHVMLHMLTHPLKPGEQVPLALALDDGSTLKFSALVKALTAE